MSIPREVSHDILKYLHSIVDSGTKLDRSGMLYIRGTCLTRNDTVVRYQKMECSDGTLS